MLINILVTIHVYILKYSFVSPKQFLFAISQSAHLKWLITYFYSLEIADVRNALRKKKFQSLTCVAEAMRSYNLLGCNPHFPYDTLQRLI